MDFILLSKTGFKKSETDFKKGKTKNFKKMILFT